MCLMTVPVPITGKGVPAHGPTYCHVLTVSRTSNNYTPKEQTIIPRRVFAYHIAISYKVVVMVGHRRLKSPTRLGG